MVSLIHVYMLSLAVPITDGTFSDQNSQHAHIDYIIKRNFTCEGEEDMLLNCAYYNRNPSYCNESESRKRPAGVYCFGQTNGQS